MSVETSARILRILLQGPGPVSGQALAAELGLSRTAVWKGVAKLIGEGVDIAASGGRGYRLIGRPGKLGPSLVAASLSSQWLGRPVHYFERTDSTNLRAKTLAVAGTPGGALVIADFQTQGRGRLKRVWRSPAGRNLLFSLLLRPRLELRSFFRLTMAAGVSLSRAVEELTGLRPELKWPNDLYLGEHKLAGILTEIAGQAQLLDWAVVGIGLNTNAAPAEEKCTCLASCCGRKIDRLALLDAFLVRFEALLDEGLPAEEIRAGWLELNQTLGRMVSVEDRGGRVSGLAVDVDADGALLVETGAGLRRVVCGDVLPA